MSQLEFKRFRRLRNNPIIRDMMRETHLSVKDFIYPLFVINGEKIKNPIKSMPDVYQMSIDVLVEECKQVRDLGIPAVILFGIPEKKDEIGSDAQSENGIIQRAISAIKQNVPDLLVIGDVCMCEYTSHGHCGIVCGNEVMNDDTLIHLSKIALAQAKAGVDMVAPSDMMDGRVAAIRQTLDTHKFKNLPIMSYSAKYASAFYGPFREAAEGAPKFGDRKSHQMDYANSDEALREVEEDIFEGADIVMVKPAGAYLDIIYRVKNEFGMPTAAYQVSGEYSMIKAAAEKGWLDHDKIMIETLTAIKRAGADMILTYFAKNMATILNKG
ncbi:porphobilinogen synthase [Bacteroidetes/Chlorobi group bacterium ChocPot_Mid]|jgi:porphobilinogen synthase|nr:MAG: porphobilinogen synthase [Bacteroidetes/Chlorobi group bacterium ChocPot_Mid]